MQEIDKNIEKFIKDLDYELIQTMFARIKAGKRLRSKLIIAIAQGKADEKQMFELCALVEIIHLASLLHDDIIDEAQIRRGAKSINAEFGAKNALMLGDILYSKAFCELTNFAKPVAFSIANAVAKLAKGELMDIELSKRFNTDEKAYQTMIEHKTAALIEASAFCAAHLAGLDEKAFGEYGKNLGLAFQIVDDILDVKNDEKTLGKPAMSDFKEGKTTLVYINLFKELNYNDKQILKNLFKKDLNADELAWLKGKMNECGAIAKTSEQARAFALQALEAIKGFENERLNEFINKMIDREF